MTMTNGALATAPARAPRIDPAPAPRRGLRAVEAPARRRRPKLLYGVVAVLCAFVIGGAQMVLSIMTTQSTYEIERLSSEQRDLQYDRQILYDEVAGLGSPQYLAANAAALGMVIEESPSYLRLSDGAVLGAEESAVGSSSIDAIGRGVVPNALVEDTPLVTSPDATIAGEPASTEVTGTGVGNTPVPITDGLPTPSTH
ncbi:hypothetical protein [Microbacterium sp. C7(2022)]|uniref:hypothetical protein n=1 Tax=Microbacterium sp. C7(2022) TaxID=2992759 RepID=UPI00237A4B1B|nr:hypothetical protein [Microbacterium sp. C7(2022)]MDE0546746.1 hypothetical protein [Microbacterium sp. C7(2022)]